MTIEEFKVCIAACINLHADRLIIGDASAICELRNDVMHIFKIHKILPIINYAWNFSKRGLHIRFISEDCIDLSVSMTIVCAVTFDKYSSYSNVETNIRWDKNMDNFAYLNEYLSSLN